MQPAAIRGLFAPPGPETAALVDGLLKRHPVALLVDGVGRSRSHHRHPFTFAERADLISRMWPDAWAAKRLAAVPLASDPYDPAGSERAVDAALATAGAAIGAGPIPRTGMIRDPADGAKQRLQLVSCGRIIGSGYPNHRLPAGLKEFSASFAGGTAWRWLNEEFGYCNAERLRWHKPPYPPTFNTGDALVVHRGRILFIRRRNWPGKGLLALPGGHLDPEETLFTAALREAYEETSPSRGGQAIPKVEFAGYVTASETFDEPWRDPRGRYITRVFRFDVAEGIDSAAGDDAESVHWLRLDDVDPAQVFADHWYIARAMTSRR